MIDTRTFGAPNWVDLSTPDVEAATRFYRDLFGWRMERSSTPMGDHVIGKVGAAQVAGMMETRPEAGSPPAVWTTFFHVPDADEAARETCRLGGSVLSPAMDIPGDARIAVVTDPTDAMFALMSGPMPAMTWMSQIAGSVCWVELLTRDTQAAEPFYGSLFGWKAVTEGGDPAPYTTFKLGDDDVAGMMTMPAEVPDETRSHWAVYFAVRDCRATAERAAALGGRVLRPPAGIGTEVFAVLADPHGAVFQLLESAGP